METLTPREIELIDLTIDRTLKALKIKATTYDRWITQNQAGKIYGVGVKRLQTAILRGLVRVKNPQRINPKERLLVDKMDVIKLKS